LVERQIKVRLFERGHDGTKATDPGLTFIARILEVGYPDKCGGDNMRGWRTSPRTRNRRRTKTIPKPTPTFSAGSRMMLLALTTWTGCVGLPVFPARIVLAVPAGA
jgi:hypothetical protein